MVKVSLATKVKPSSDSSPIDDWEWKSCVTGNCLVCLVSGKLGRLVTPHLGCWSSQQRTIMCWKTMFQLLRDQHIVVVVKVYNVSDDVAVLVCSLFCVCIRTRMPNDTVLGIKQHIRLQMIVASFFFSTPTLMLFCHIFCLLCVINHILYC